MDHIIAATGGDLAASARLDEIDALAAAILDDPASGRRLSGPLEGWRVRHGGRDRMITMVFRADVAGRRLLLALIAFGGRDWASMAPARRFE